MMVIHHGELEFGSPKVPLFAEALLLHHLDNLDSKMELARAAVERDRLIDGEWTAYVSPLDRSLLKKQKYLNAETAPPAEPVATPPPAHLDETPVPVKRLAPSSSPFGAKLKDALHNS